MVYVRGLVWNDWNVEHIARHNVTPQEVEEACLAGGLVLRGKKGRLVFIAPTRAGAVLAVVLDPEPEEEGIYYPVTGRPASRKERRLYEARKKGDDS